MNDNGSPSPDSDPGETPWPVYAMIIGIIAVLTLLVLMSAKTPQRHKEPLQQDKAIEVRK